jgi:hypothetical protein
VVRHPLAYRRMSTNGLFVLEWKLLVTKLNECETVSIVISLSYWISRRTSYTCEGKHSDWNTTERFFVFPHNTVRHSTSFSIGHWA